MLSNSLGWNWVQLHLGINHVPLVLLIVGGVLAGINSLRADAAPYQLLVRLLGAAGGLCALAAYHTGLNAAQRLQETNMALVQEYVIPHKALAEPFYYGWWLLLVYALALVGLERRWPQYRRWFQVVLMFLMLGGAVALMVIAHAGSQIRHPLLR
jgi:glucan phosphoethanolaminetransferase (alkaline phosphatase superfamily)